MSEPCAGPNKNIMWWNIRNILWLIRIWCHWPPHAIPRDRDWLRIRTPLLVLLYQLSWIAYNDVITLWLYQCKPRKINPANILSDKCRWCAPKMGCLARFPHEVSAFPSKTLDAYGSRWRLFTREDQTRQSVEHVLTPSLAETEMYSSIFVFLFIIYTSMLQPVMSHEPYNSLLSLLSAHSMDILVWSSYRNTRMSTNRYVAACTNTLF